ncbi:hypothetical protein AB3S75_006962 [Citrus x aurantiifolia]
MIIGSPRGKVLLTSHPSSLGVPFFFFLPFPVFGTSAHTTSLKHSQEPYSTDDQKLSTKKHLVVLTLSSAKAEAHDEGTEKKTLRVQKNVYRGIRLGHGENGQLRRETVTRAFAFGLAFST